MSKDLLALIFLFAAIPVSRGGDGPRSFSPETDQSRTLGDPGRRWGTVYSAEINDGQGNSINVADAARYMSEKDHAALSPGSRAAADAHPIGAITGLSNILKPATQASDGLMSAADKATLDNASLSNVVRHTLAGDIQLPEANAFLGRDGAGNAVNLANVGADGSAKYGDTSHRTNLQASVRPTTQIGDEATPRRNAFLEDIEDVYETSADHDADMAYKADLVGGRVPESQMPPSVISKNYTVSTQADLVTLTQAVIGDHALTGAGTTDDPHHRFLLWSEPPTDINNWIDITGGGGGGAGNYGVVSWAGKSGVVVPEIEDVTGLRAELDDKANAADLADYAPLNSPALTGTPTAPTPAASATGSEIMTAAAVNTKMTSNLANTAPSMVRTDGVSTAGSSATVSRSDHEHGIVAATAATETDAGAAGSVVYAADNDTTSRDKAVTPAGVAKAIASNTSDGLKMKDITTSGSGTLDNAAGVLIAYIVSGGGGGSASPYTSPRWGACGGGGGIIMHMEIVPANVQYTVVAGKGGAGGYWSNGNYSATNGGVTSLTINGNTYTS